jgi:hypothetical protein
MSNAAVISASFSDFRLVKGRKVAQLILEVPIEQAQAALEALGGVPMPHEDRWCAVALLTPEKPAAVGNDKESGKRAWGDMKLAQQAGILCADAEFIAWLSCDTQEAAVNEVRRRCGVASRADLDRDPDAAEAWMRLVREYRDRHNLQSLEKAYYGR